MPRKTADSYAKDYTKPALRAKLKERIKASAKGGKPGQWSARKSQLLSAEYQKEGGRFKHAKGKPQKDLEKWTKEEWQTSDGSARARRGKTTSRYLPKKAWEKLTPAEKTATDAKKKQASRKGRQTVANTKKAQAARRAVKK